VEDRNREEQAIAKVPKGALFEHYKGKKYQVLGVARHTETLKMCVVYQALYDSPQFGDYAVWVRPLEMFLETVVVEGKEIPRFRLITQDVR
jgi:hypothetical protein